MGSIAGPETESLYALEQLNPWATATEAARCNWRGRAPRRRDAAKILRAQLRPHTASK